MQIDIPCQILDVPPAGFEYFVTEMVCWPTGGPQKYTRPLDDDSHRHLNITPKEWDTFMKDFEQTMDKFKVVGHDERSFEDRRKHLRRYRRRHSISAEALALAESARRFNLSV
jgi:hypothetical protein